MPVIGQGSYYVPPGGTPPAPVIPIPIQSGPMQGGSSAYSSLPNDPNNPASVVGYGSTLVNGVNYPTQVPQNVVGGTSGAGDNVNPGGEESFLKKYGMLILAGIAVYLFLE